MESNDNPAGANKYNPNDIVRDYVLKEQLGGKHSSTFRAVSNLTQETVAIKVISKLFPNSTTLYKAEIDAYRSLRGVAGTLQLKYNWEDDAAYFIVTEYIQGGSVRNIIKTHPEGMSVEDVIQLFSPVADAIDRIHGKNIIHRDLKPENILHHKTDTGYNTFITDFGVVKFVTVSKQFRTETTAGTSWYIAPEALYADPKSPQTRAVDIYALGVMLYEALEGRAPFEYIDDVLRNKPLYPTRTSQKTDALVVDCLLRTISYDPEQRPKSAKEVVDEIRNAHAGNLSPQQKWVGRKFKFYDVEDVLGVGKMGISLRAKDTQTNTQVVLKAFIRSLSGNAIQAYEKEKKSLDRLENGHGVLKPRDGFEHDGILFIVTDYQNGGSLRNLLDRRAKLTPAETLEIFTQIAESIDYLHEKRVVHRDIKPENIVYNTHNGKITPFITDFGVSIILASTQSSFTTHEIGTPRYMAPELWDPNTKGTKAVDIYAFGIMLYEALEGRAPFEANHPAIIKQHLSQTVPPPQKTLEDLGPNARDVLLQTLAKDPEERPKTATEIMQQIKGQHAMFLGQRYGKYTIEKFVGQGTYGATYRAFDKSKNQRKKFAFKVLTIPRPLMNEIEPLKKLGDHEGIVPVLDGNSEKGINYMVTEFRNGMNFREMLQSNRLGMNLDEVLKIFKPVAKALDYLHSNDIVHGDLKPESIILCKGKTNDDPLEPVVTGFGVSKIAGKVLPYHSKDNCNYIAPELWEDREPSRASDVYAFGVMLYETLEGTPPFNAKTLAGIMRQHLYEHAPTPRNLLHSSGKEAVHVLLQSLDKKAERRQKSATDLVSQLADIAQNRVPSPLGPLMERLNRISNAGKQKVEVSISRLAIYAIALAAIFAFVFYQGAQYIFVPPTVTPLTPDLTQPFATEVTSTEIIQPPDPTAPPTTDIPITLTPSKLLECHQYPPDQEGWPKEYPKDSYIELLELYQRYYGPQRDKYDLYALAYYNNRKALETDLYHMIDPVELGIERGWNAFLPHVSWIEAYKEFPRPVLETFEPDNGYTTINISGSSTLYPLSLQIARCFEAATPSHDIQIEPNNTRSGLIDFCQGSVEIFGASEEITPEMITGNGCLDVEFLRFAIAKYAAVIFINDNNPYADEIREKPLSDEELARLLFSAKLWSNVRNNWAGEPIIRYFPPVEGGAFEIVRNKILPILSSNAEIANLKRIEESNLIPLMVTGNEFSIGFSSFADYQGRKGDLIAIPIGNVLPNLETIKGDKYPLTRLLYLYTGKTTFDENPLLRYFINYYLAYELDFLEELGYFYPNKDGFLTDQYYPKPK